MGDERGDERAAGRESAPDRADQSPGRSHDVEAVGNDALALLARSGTADQLAGAVVDPSLASAIGMRQGAGNPLPDDTREKMESHIGSDLSHARVHTDGAASTLSRTLQAKAFTVGSDVFFAQGRYDPGSEGGDRLLAHELTHVVQQGSAGSSSGPLTISDPSDTHEREADEVAASVGRAALPRPAQASEPSAHLAREPNDEAEQSQQAGDRSAATWIELPTSNLAKLRQFGLAAIATAPKGEFAPRQLLVVAGSVHACDSGGGSRRRYSLREGRVPYQPGMYAMYVSERGLAVKRAFIADGQVGWDFVRYRKDAELPEWMRKRQAEQQGEDGTGNWGIDPKDWIEFGKGELKLPALLLVAPGVADTSSDMGAGSAEVDETKGAEGETGDSDGSGRDAQAGRGGAPKAGEEGSGKSKYSPDFKGESPAKGATITAPPLPIEVTGTETLAVGGTGDYSARVDSSDPLGAFDVLGAGTFWWEVWDVSEEVRGSGAANHFGKPGKGASADGDKAEKEKQAAADAAVEGARTGELKDESERDGAGSITSRFSHDMSKVGEDAVEQAVLYEERKKHAGTANTLNQALFGFRVVGGTLGAVKGALVDVFTEDQKQLSRAFEKDGYFVVRCVVGFRPNEENETRAPSSGALAVVVQSPKKVARDWFDSPHADLEELQLALKIAEASGEAEEAAKARAQIDALEASMTASPVELLNRARLATAKDLATARAKENGSQVKRLEAELKDLDRRIAKARTQEEALTDSGGGSPIRVRGLFVSDESGDQRELLIQVTSPRRTPGFDPRKKKALAATGRDTLEDAFVCEAADATLGDDTTEKGYGPSKIAATREAIHEAVRRSGYGKGWVAIELPNEGWIATEKVPEGRRRHRLRVTTTDLQATKENLEATARVFTTVALGSGMALKGAQALTVASGVIDSGIAASRIVERARTGTLAFDAELVGDLLSILGTMTLGAKSLGGLKGLGLKVDGDRFRLFLRAAEGADEVADVVDIIHGRTTFLNELAQISDQERSGKLTPNEARRRRANAAASQLEYVALKSLSKLKEAGDHQRRSAEEIKALEEARTAHARDVRDTLTERTPPAGGRDAATPARPPARPEPPVRSGRPRPETVRAPRPDSDEVGTTKSDADVEEAPLLRARKAEDVVIHEDLLEGMAFTAEGRYDSKLGGIGEAFDEPANLAALDQSARDSPYQEHALARNTLTGRYMIVAGNEGTALTPDGLSAFGADHWRALLDQSELDAQGKPLGRWEYMAHTHPWERHAKEGSGGKSSDETPRPSGWKRPQTESAGAPGKTKGPPPVPPAAGLPGAKTPWPSGVPGDFDVIMVYVDRGGGKTAVEQTVRYLDKGGKVRVTRYGFDPSQARPYWVQRWDQSVPERFRTIEDYHRDRTGQNADDIPADWVGHKHQPGPKETETRTTKPMRAVKPPPDVDETAPTVRAPKGTDTPVPGKEGPDEGNRPTPSLEAAGPSRDPGVADLVAGLGRPDNRAAATTARQAILASEWKTLKGEVAKLRGTDRARAEAHLVAARDLLIRLAKHEVKTRYPVELDDFGTKGLSSDVDANWRPRLEARPKAKDESGRTVADDIRHTAAASKLFLDELREAAGGDPDLKLDVASFSYLGEGQARPTDDFERGQVGQIERDAAVAALVRLAGDGGVKALKDQLKTFNLDQFTFEQQYALELVINEATLYAKRLEMEVGSREVFIRVGNPNEISVADARKLAVDQLTADKKEQLAKLFEADPMNPADIVRLQIEIRWLDTEAYLTGATIDDVIAYGQQRRGLTEDEVTGSLDEEERNVPQAERRTRAVTSMTEQMAFMQKAVAKETGAAQVRGVAKYASRILTAVRSTDIVRTGPVERALEDFIGDRMPTTISPRGERQMLARWLGRMGDTDRAVGIHRLDENSAALQQVRTEFVAAVVDWVGKSVVEMLLDTQDPTRGVSFDPNEYY